MSTTFSQPNSSTTAADASFTAWGVYELPVMMKKEVCEPTPDPVPVPTPAPAFGIKLTFCKPGTNSTTPDVQVNCSLFVFNGQDYWQGTLTGCAAGSGNTVRIYRVVNGVQDAGASDSVTLNVVAGSPALPAPPSVVSVPPPPV